MAALFTWVLLLFACWGENAYIVEGTVVQVNGVEEVVIDHKPIEGLGMDAMTMPFEVRDPALVEGLEPGHRLIARFEIDETGGYLTKVRVTGKGPAPEPLQTGRMPLKVGQALPTTPVRLADGSETVLGEGQPRPTLLTFLYTRCPLPDFCPATVSKFQAVQAALAREGGAQDVRLLAVTLDPVFDTPEVLTRFAADSSADPAIWQFGEVEGLADLAISAALGVQRIEAPGQSPEQIEITHGIRVLVLDAEGKLVERYDDHAFPVDRVIAQLRTGEPRAK
jgi:protein SCO1/2